MRRNGFYMHNRGRYFVQQLNGNGAAPGFSFVAPQTNGFVQAFVSDGSNGFYMGGSFTSVTDSVATYTTGYARFVRLKANGDVDPSFSCPVNNAVNAIAVDSTGVYIGGLFSGANSVGTSTRNRIARVRPFNDPSPGAVDAWNPGLSSGTSPRCLVLDSVNGKLYVGGDFTSVGGAGTNNNPAVTRARFARFSTGASGVADAYRIDCSAAPFSFALDSANGKLYVGLTSGNTTVGGVGSDVNPSQTRRGLMRVTTGVSGTLDTWNPNVTSGNVRALIFDAANSKLYVGGDFTSVGAASGVDITPAQTRNGAARLGTGASATLDAWNPNVGGATKTVFGMNHDTLNGFLYLYGSFLSVGGTTRNRIARVSDGATATLDTAWDPNVSNPSNAAVTQGLLFPVVGKLIIAGEFNTIVNQVDTLGVNVAALDT
jgi:hypothetical protein